MLYYILPQLPGSVFKVFFKPEKINLLHKPSLLTTQIVKNSHILAKIYFPLDLSEKIGKVVIKDIYQLKSAMRKKVFS